MPYQTISNIFKENECDLNASEAHGLATGLLCIDNQSEAANWLSHLFSDQKTLITEDKTILVALFEQTRQLLNNEDDSFAYNLFLPDEGESFVTQLEALRFWCEGFLFGVGYSRLSADWSAETNEIMKDIIEFTKLDVATETETDNEDETAMMEIQEYLRIAVITLKDRL